MMTNQITLPRILPRNVHSEHAYAYGYLCGIISNIELYHKNGDTNEVNQKLLELFAAVNQLKSEMYPNG